MRVDRKTGAVLVAMLALAKADGATIGVLAPALRTQFHFDDARLGVLASLASITGALSALPAGGLVDRRHRPLLLGGALAVWSIALGLAGLATGFVVLAVARLFSGCVSTVARPAAVSLVGDVYRADRRGRVMAALDAGQSAGTAVCFVIAALALRWFSWRMAFWWLAAAGLILAVVASRLPDPGPERPKRRLSRRALRAAAAVCDTSGRLPTEGGPPAYDRRAGADLEGRPLALTTGLDFRGRRGPPSKGAPSNVTARRGHRTEGVAPEATGPPDLTEPASEGMTLRSDGRPVDAVLAGPSIRAVLRELVGIRTNAVVLLAEAVGNFFFAGVTSFGVLFATERYGLSTARVDAIAPLVGIGIIAGLLVGGRLGDRMAHKAGGSRRLVLACILDLVAAGLLVPAIAFRSMIICGLLLFVAAAVLAGSGPCLDAVRIDIVRPVIRGRAEAARGLLTLGAGAAAPIIFGIVAMSLGGHQGHGEGLRDAFLLMLLPLAASGLILIAGIRTYAADAAAAGTDPGPAPVPFAGRPVP